MSHTTNQATIDMFDDVVAASVRLHRDDPVSNWIFGPGEDLEQRLKPWLDVWIEAFIKLGNVWCFGDALGVAILLPPDDLVDLYDAEQRAWPIVLEMAEHPHRYDLFWDWTIDTGARVGYRLVELNVDPGHRRQGIGAALTEHCVDIAHRDGEPVHVVAPSLSSAEYFQQVGFEVMAEGQPPGGGPTGWILSR